MIIVSYIKAVDKEFYRLIRTVCATIKMIAEQFGGKFDIGFANVGDQKNKNRPEKSVCDEFKIKLIDGLGYKIQSSSLLFKKL